jgi:DNA ligase-1
MAVAFEEVAEALSRIESLSKRLEMTDELISLMMNKSPEEVEIIVRLVKGEIRPGFEGLEIGVAEKLAVKALYQVSMVPLDEIEKRRKIVGDIGILTEEIMKRKMQMSLFSENLTVERVFGNLEKISLVEGRSSQDLKLKLIAELLHDSSPLEARYISRMVCGKMRLGIADMTVVDALSYILTTGFGDLSREILEIDDLDDGVKKLADDLVSHRTSELYSLIEIFNRPKKNDIEEEKGIRIKERLMILRDTVQRNRERIVRSYNIHPDLGYISRKYFEKGMTVANEINVQPGIPLRAMLGERLTSVGNILEKMKGTAAFEYKYDGLRIQAHLFRKDDDLSIRLYSRQLEDLTEQFPDVADYLKSSFTGIDTIIEGECVPIDQNTGDLLPFQLISQRRGRKYDLGNKMDEIPVAFVIFDCLYANGSDMTEIPYLERRDELKKIFSDLFEDIDIDKGISLSKMEIIENEEDGEEFFQKALQDGCEGIMAKSVSKDSIYQAGNRGWLWIKYKRDYRSELSDTLDLVAIGAFHGTGRRRGTYGALLMACYDQKEGAFKSVCKLGSGFNDEHLSILVDQVDSLKGSRREVWKNVDCKMEPDVYMLPSMVMEVLGAEITFSPMHTCSFGRLKDDSGLALRFPRFTGRFRDDKGPTDATTESEIESMYRSQTKLIR